MVVMMGLRKVDLTADSSAARRVGTTAFVRAGKKVVMRGLMWAV